MPRFSILMPTFNRPSFLQKAVQAILDQDFQDWELLIKDGGTQPSQFSDPRITYLNYPDTGISNAMNQLMPLVKGDLLNWSNDDDVMLPGTLSFVNEFIGDAVWMYGRIKYGERAYGLPFNYQHLLKANIIPQPAVFWHKAVADLLPSFDERYNLASDYDYWLRLARRWTPKYTDRILAEYTIHDEQASKRNEIDQALQANEIRRQHILLS